MAKKQQLARNANKFTYLTWGAHMKYLTKKVQDFLSDEQGATAVEYGMIVALIAAVIVVAVSTLGGKIDTAVGAINKVRP